MVVTLLSDVLKTRSEDEAFVQTMAEAGHGAVRRQRRFRRRSQMDPVLQGLLVLIQPGILSFLLIVGAIPGLNDNITFAIFTPFAFGMEASHALALMVGVYCSTSVGSAVLTIMSKVAAPPHSS